MKQCLRCTCICCTRRRMKRHCGILGRSTCIQCQLFPNCPCFVEGNHFPKPEPKQEAWKARTSENMAQWGFGQALFDGISLTMISVAFSMFPTGTRRNWNWICVNKKGPTFTSMNANYLSAKSVLQYHRCAIGCGWLYYFKKIQNILLAWCKKSSSMRFVFTLISTLLRW